MKRIVFLTTLAVCLAVAACSATDVVGPQSSAKAVAKAWAEAIVARDCNRAANLMSPDQRRYIHLNCNPSINHYDFVSARIDDAVDRPQDWSNSPDNERKVTLAGAIVRQSGYVWETLDIYVERLEGKWYVTGSE